MIRNVTVSSSSSQSLQGLTRGGGSRNNNYLSIVGTLQPHFCALPQITYSPIQTRTPFSQSRRKVTEIDRVRQRSRNRLVSSLCQHTENTRILPSTHVLEPSRCRHRDKKTLEVQHGRGRTDYNSTLHERVQRKKD